MHLKHWVGFLVLIGSFAHAGHLDGGDVSKGKLEATQETSRPTLNAADLEYLQFERDNQEMMLNEPGRFQAGKLAIYRKHDFRRLTEEVNRYNDDLLETRVAKGIIKFFSDKELEFSSLHEVFQSAVRFHAFKLFYEVSELRAEVKSDKWFSMKKAKAIRNISLLEKRVNDLSARMRSIEYLPVATVLQKVKQKLNRMIHPSSTSAPINTFYIQDSYDTQILDFDYDAVNRNFSEAMTHLSQSIISLRERVLNQERSKSPQIVRKALEAGVERAQSVGHALGSVVVGTGALLGQGVVGAGSLTRNVILGAGNLIVFAGEQSLKFGREDVPFAFWKSVGFGTYVGKEIQAGIMQAPAAAGGGIYLVFYHYPKTVAVGTKRIGSEVAAQLSEGMESMATGATSVAFYLGENVGDIAKYPGRLSQFREEIYRKIDETSVDASLDQDERKERIQLLKRELKWFKKNLRQLLQSDAWSIYCLQVEKTAADNVRAKREFESAIAEIEANFEKDKDEYLRQNDISEEIVALIVQVQEKVFRSYLELATKEKLLANLKNFPLSWDALMVTSRVSALDTLLLNNTSSEHKGKGLTVLPSKKVARNRVEMKDAFESLCDELSYDCRLFLSRSKIQHQKQAVLMQRFDLIEKRATGQLTPEECVGSSSELFKLQTIATQLISESNLIRNKAWNKIVLGVSKKLNKEKYLLAQDRIDLRTCEKVEKDAAEQTKQFEAEWTARRESRKERSYALYLKILRDTPENLGQGDSEVPLVIAVPEGKMALQEGQGCEQRFELCYVPFPDRLEPHDHTIFECSLGCDRDVAWKFELFESIQKDATFEENRAVLVPDNEGVTSNRGIRLVCGHLCHENCLKPRFIRANRPVECGLCRTPIALLVLDEAEK